jgi:hypothetical protein
MAVAAGEVLDLIDKVDTAAVGLGVEAGTAGDVCSELPPGIVGLAIAFAGVSAMGGS